MKTTKHSIAFAVWHDQRSKVLVVQRPAHDPDLPNVWGLPAGTLKDGESHEDCVLRSGQEKLGVALIIVKIIGEGETEREQFTLHMKEYEVKIKDGTPSVPQPIPGITQYQRWQWAEPSILHE